jgi:hypothetical protein
MIVIDKQARHGNPYYWVKYTNGKEEKVLQIGSEWYMVRNINNIISHVRINDPSVVNRINNAVENYNN